MRRGQEWTKRLGQSCAERDRPTGRQLGELRGGSGKLLDGLWPVDRIKRVLAPSQSYTSTTRQDSIRTVSRLTPSHDAPDHSSPGRTAFPPKGSTPNLRDEEKSLRIEEC